MQRRRASTSASPPRYLADPLRSHASVKAMRAGDLLSRRVSSGIYRGEPAMHFSSVQATRRVGGIVSVYHQCDWVLTDSLTHWLISLPAHWFTQWLAAWAGRTGSLADRASCLGDLGRGRTRSSSRHIISSRYRRLCPRSVIVCMCVRACIRVCVCLRA